MTPSEPDVGSDAAGGRGDSGGYEDVELRRARWATGWRRVVFPGVFLFYLGQTAHGVADHSDGLAAVAGYVILAAFGVCYMRALPEVFGGVQGRFPYWYGALVLLMIAELPFAHEDAFVMVTYIVVLSLAAIGRRSWPIIAVLVAVAMFLPPLIPSWHAGVDTDAALSTALVTLAMYGFFEIVRSNRALTEARSEVARLAAESERSRIARDLHDLLGHSLTTITVKAGLARRLASVDPDRAASEIAEVEELSRRSLADVRAAVAGYREVTLTGELASGRELLRAVGIDADLPRSTDEVRGDLHELFGWVVREGLTNVVRHSRAARCTITLTPDSVEIVDNGIAGAGAGRSGAGPGRREDGSGLQGLHERVEAAGGTLDAAAHGRTGWRLRVQVPATITETTAATDPAPRAEVPAATDAATTEPAAGLRPEAAAPFGATDGQSPVGRIVRRLGGRS